MRAISCFNFILLPRELSVVFLSSWRQWLVVETLRIMYNYKIPDRSFRENFSRKISCFCWFREIRIQIEQDVINLLKLKSQNAAIVDKLMFCLSRCAAIRDVLTKKQHSNCEV